ncbi:MAG: hypothetical protein R2754_05890 [Microthrixaceae bacterium]
MTRAAQWVYEGIDQLLGVSPVLDGLMARHGAPLWGRPLPARDRFATLARMIAFQQLAGAAASSIWARVEAATGGAPITPEATLAVGPDGLRAAGLSTAKVAALTDLSERVVDGRLRLGRLGTLDDEQVVERLVTVRGIGEWSAQMFLLNALRRHDVWPCADLGVRAGWGKAHGTATPTAAQMPDLGEPFRPYRSLVAWYCWRSADTLVPEAG